MRAKPPEKSEVLDVGTCLRRFTDKHGRIVDLSVSSAGDDEIHSEAEETLREHGGDADYATIGTSPVLGAIFSTKDPPEPGTHAEVFTGPWHVTLYSASGKKGALCTARALGELGDRATRRLPAQPEPAATPKKPKHK